MAKTYLGIIHRYFQSGGSFKVHRIEADLKEDAEDKIYAKAHRAGRNKMDNFSAVLVDPREHGFEERP
jgi:hypothetical protein